MTKRGVPPRTDQRTQQSQRSTNVGTLAGRLYNSYPVARKPAAVIVAAVTTDEES